MANLMSWWGMPSLANRFLSGFLLGSILFFQFDPRKIPKEQSKAKQSNTMYNSVIETTTTNSSVPIQESDYRIQKFKMLIGI